MSQITTVVRDLQLSKKIEETEVGSTEAEKSRYWGLNVIGKFKNLELKGWGNALPVCQSENPSGMSFCGKCLVFWITRMATTCR